MLFIYALLEIYTSPSAWYFAERKISGRSANKYFTECCARQNNVLGKASFAECQTLGKEKRTAK